MKLVIGLGNPGAAYKNTRHNVGFLVVDELAKEWRTAFQEKAKFKAQLAETEVEGEKVLLVKPTTFYNLSGEAARAVRDFYKLENSDILVIHDELALPFGTIRARLGGQDAGNNGIKSLSNHLGEAYARIRVGIWSEHREQVEPADFVLTKFSPSHIKTVKNQLAKLVKASVATFIRTGQLEHETQKIP